MTGWDPATKKAIEATARADAIDTTIGTARSSVVGALSGGKIHMASNPVATREEAEALAKSVADRLGNAYLEASGEARGNPKLRAGADLKIDGVGDRFGGTYSLASTSHVYRGGVGYKTRFAISGRAERSLVERTSADPSGRRTLTVPDRSMSLPATTSVSAGKPLSADADRGLPLGVGCGGCSVKTAVTRRTTSASS